MLLGLGAAAYAVTGEFNNLCTEGLASHKIVHTDCSVNGTYKGKSYCFGNEAAKKEFFKNPSARQGRSLLQEAPRLGWAAERQSLSYIWLAVWPKGKGGSAGSERAAGIHAIRMK
jgi:YHS domain-containing protein